jgi:NAD(P)-dependent dehydrogenase (short-subunit alcohol dehydrogenase family)
MPVEAPIVVVTGANRGIGREVARQLAARGARVVLTARSAEAAAAAAAAIAPEVAATGGAVEAHPLDVTRPESVAALAAHLEGTHGRVDALVNNAGVITPDDAPVLEVQPEAIRTTLETNTLGPLRVAQALAPLLRKSADGRIVNVSSGMGALTEGMGPDHAGYRLSKAALNAVTAMLTSALRGEVLVFAMCPGWVRTDMGGPEAERDVAEGADTAVWLVLEAPASLGGAFVRDRARIDW